MAVCSICQEDKPTSEFHACKSRKSGIRPDCKECRKKESRRRYLDKGERIKSYAADYRKNNPTANKDYYLNNSGYFKAYRQKHSERYKEWRDKNRASVKVWKRRKLAEDPSYKVACALRSYLSTKLRRSKACKSRKTEDLLGCSFTEFKDYLERKFKEGMSWDNYGEWHIDHIKPCSQFDLSKVEEQASCFHHTNMQPLWAKENLIKGKKYASQL